MKIKSKHSLIKYFLLYSWVILILSQVLKNNYALIYFAIFFVFLFLNSLFIFKKGFFFKGDDFFKIQIWFFYILLIYVSSLTFLYGDLSDFLKAFPRMMLMPLTFLIFINFISNKNQIKSILNILIFFSVIAAFSLIYQVYMGPLNFLVDSATRAGLTRYASTFGSLTIYGGAVGIITLLVIRKNFNFFIKTSILTLFLLSAFLTLAKAAIMNILLVTIFSLFFLKIENKKKIISIIILSIFLIFYIFPDLGIYISKTIDVLGFSKNEIETNQTASLYYQVLKRAFYSIEYLSDFNIVNLFFGFGLIGGQGVFGLPYSFTGTTHNQFMDLYLIGGVFLFLNIIFIVICLMLELYKMKKKDVQAETFFFCNIIGIINMVFFNGFIFQPITSFVFWLSIVYVLHFKENDYEKSI